MENKNKCVRRAFSAVSCGTVAVLLCVAPALCEDVTVPSGQIWGIDYAVTGNLYVDGTANLLTGASVSDSIYVQTGGTLNMYSGTIGESSFVSVSPEAVAMTVYGTDFALDNNPVEYGALPVPSGTLTGTYGGGSSITLWIMSGIDINLQPPPTGEPIAVDIDIKPGSYPNTINLGSNGVVPVAILSSETLDATTLNPDNVFLAGSGVAVRGKGNNTLAHEEDVNSDGLPDLVVKVETENLLEGEFQDGGAFLRVHETSDQTSPVLYEGWDEITIVPPE